MKKTYLSVFYLLFSIIILFLPNSYGSIYHPPGECERLYNTPFDQRNAQGYTILHLAAADGLDFALDCLYDAPGAEQADWNIQDGEYNQAPLHHAVIGNHLKAVEWLVDSDFSDFDYPVKIDAKDQGGSTPFHYACGLGYLSIAKFLEFRGANIDELNNKNKRPIDLAFEQGHKDVVEFLKSKGSRLSSEPPGSWTF